MNQTDRSNKKTNAYARKQAKGRGKKEQEERDKNITQQKLNSRGTRIASNVLPLK